MTRYARNTYGQYDQCFATWPRPAQGIPLYMYCVPLPRLGRQSLPSSHSDSVQSTVDDFSHRRAVVHVSIFSPQDIGSMPNQWTLDEEDLLLMVKKHCCISRRPWCKTWNLSCMHIIDFFATLPSILLLYTLLLALALLLLLSVFGSFGE